jgi:hypothetical protein
MKSLPLPLLALLATTACNSGGSGAATACEAFADEPAAASVTVRIHNETGGPIGVRQSIAYTITPAAGDDGVDYARYSCAGTTTCDEHRADHACPGVCGATGYDNLATGASLDQTWSGTGFRAAEMPVACFAAPFCTPLPSSGTAACLQRIAAAPGEYAVRVEAYLDCDTLECPPPSTPVTSAPVTFTFPDTAVVDVVVGASGP